MENTKKEKRLYFIQMHENFFANEDMQLIKELAVERNFNINNMQILYIKLLLKAIDSDGFIHFNKPITPQNLKALLSYSSGEGYQHDLDFLNKAIPFLEEIQLIKIYVNQAIFVNNALNYTMSKLEDSERRHQQRILNKKLKEADKSITTSFEDEANDYLKALKTNWIPALIYCGYIQENKSINYYDCFEKLIDWNCTIDEITAAISKMVQRSLEMDSWSNIKIDKKIYLERMLFNIIRDEIRTGAAVYDEVFENLNYLGYISKSSDYMKILTAFQKMEKRGFTKEEVIEAAYLFIKENRKVSVENLDSPISFLIKRIQENLEKIERK